MDNVVPFSIHRDWTEKIKSIRFGKRKLTIIDERGNVKNYMFITVENTKNKKFKVSGYTRYFYFEGLGKTRIETLDYHAKVIVSFLNYVFFEKYKVYRIRKITDLDIKHGNEYLRDLKDGRIGNDQKTRQTVEKVEQVLNKFYRFLLKECKDMEFVQKEDVHVKVSYSKQYGNVKQKFKREQDIYNTLFQVDYSSITASPPERIKSISSFVFSELLTLCDIHYPQLKLALCLQAFAGLRRGEVCNVSQDKIQYSMYGLDIGWFSINLKEVTQLRTDGIITGGIKKRRIQPVHPVFLSMFQEIYNQHLKLIEHVKNPFGALFLNRYGEAMTSQDYENKFTRLVKLLIERLLNNGDFLSLSEANLLMSGRMNTHVLRHFFTQFISELEQTRSPVEIAYWRGDSSLETAIIYLSHHPLIDDKISFIQKKVYEDLSR